MGPSRDRRSAVGPVAALALACAGALPAQARAQNNNEINAAVELNLVPPGARGLAMGSAFVGLADDATAAYTNPAGLTTLVSPEVSVEARLTEFSTLFTDRGNAGTVSGVGIDTIPGLVNGTAESSVTNVPFGSVVYPIGRWAFGLYRHELSRLETGFETQGAFLRDDSRLFPVQAEMRLRIVNFGLSAAFRLGAGVTLGAGASLYDFEIDSTTRRFPFGLLDPAVGEPGSFRGPPDFVHEHQNEQLQQGSDRALGLNAGIAWRPSRRWSVGLAFRDGPRFSMSSLSRAAPRFEPLVPTEREATFRIPDSLSLGAAFRPTDLLTVAFDVQRVWHSQRLSDFFDVFVLPEDDDSRVAARQFAIDDTNQLHLGLEYVLTFLPHPVALRGGVWTDPDHRIRYSADPLQETGTGEEALFRAGPDYVHYTFGLGWVPSARVQVDLGADLSPRVKTGTLSLVVRF